IPCTSFEVFAAPGGPPGFLSSTRPAECNFGGECYYGISYLPWQTSIVDMRPLIGQTVTIEFKNDWCIYGPDWGYAYLDAQCLDLKIREVCLGQNVLLEAPEGGTSYLWSNGATTQSVSVSAAGTYTCTITPAQGSSCSFELEYVYTPSSVNASFSVVNNILCNNQPISFQSNVTGTSGPVDYLWYFGNNLNSTAANPSNVYVNPGNYDVSLVVTNPANGCQDSVVQPITINSAPQPNITGTFSACDGNTVTLTVPGTYSSYLWNNGSTSNSITTGTGGSYSITVTSSNGCSAVATQNVTIYNNPIPSITGMFEVCDGNLAELTVSNGYASYQWSNGQNTSTINPGINGIYTITVTDANGCSGSASQSVVIQPLPNVSFATTDVCLGNPTLFTNNTSIVPASNLSYSWNFGDLSAGSSQFQPSHIFAATGTYSVTLTATSAFGCTDSASASAKVHGYPTPLVSTVGSGCNPYLVSFVDSSSNAGAPIVSWLWNFGNGFTSTDQNPVQSYANAGVYNVTLTVTDQNGCAADSLFPGFITVYQTPEASFYTDPVFPSVFLSSVYFYNTSTNADTYIWDFGDGMGSSEEDPYHYYENTGSYLVQLVAQNAFGCIDTITKLMEVKDDYALWTPNAFSPNGDGINDQFNPRGFNVFDFTLAIYNRWGYPMFVTDDLNQGWDGKTNGTEAPQDIYVFTIEFRDLFKKQHFIKGKVALVR
ncbi:MAG: PKD domain-containing protein, partial [Bacteroidia bacterium]